VEEDAAVPVGEDAREGRRRKKKKKCRGSRELLNLTSSREFQEGRPALSSIVERRKESVGPKGGILILNTTSSTT